MQDTISTHNLSHNKELDTLKIEVKNAVSRDVPAKNLEVIDLNVKKITPKSTFTQPKETSNHILDFDYSETALKDVYSKDTLKEIVLGHNVEIISHNNDNLITKEAQSFVLGDTIYAILVTVVLALFCNSIYKYKTIAISILNFPFSKFAEENLRESAGTIVTKTLRIFSLLYSASFMLGMSKLTLMYAPNHMGSALKEYGIIAFTAIFMLLYLYYTIIDRVLVFYNPKTNFFQELHYEKMLVGAFLGLILTPITLLTIFADNGMFQVTHFIYLFVAISSLCYFYIKICLYFNKGKVSFLQYILYFCAVDFVPISFFYVVINRYLGLLSH